MKLQVLVDMDGVLADVYAHLIDSESNESGITLHADDLYGKLEEEAFPSFNKHINSVGFFETAPLITDSVEGLKYLNDKYSVLIVSSATEFPNSMNEKCSWLSRYFPFISWKQMIFCGSKDSIKGDIMIDDHPKNLSKFGGKKLLFTQPHNVYERNKCYHRVSNWKEIVNIL